MADLPYFSHAIECGWVAEHSNLPLEQVDAVLSVEWEYMVATGIATKPEGEPDLEFCYYQAGELDGAPRYIDTKRIAEDAERLAGVPFDVGLKVLDVEAEFLELRGLSHPRDGQARTDEQGDRPDGRRQPGNGETGRGELRPPGPVVRG